MTKKHALPCGSWPSPLSSSLVAANTHDLSQLRAQGDCLYWVEQFPEQKGRRAILCMDAYGELHEKTNRQVNIRSRVHEYGGGDYVVHQQVLYFSNDRDQRWYRQDPGHEPLAITPEPPRPMAWRYADAIISPGGDYLIAVRETHQADLAVVNDIVTIPTDGSAVMHPAAITVLVQGEDFYASPCLNSAGDELLYISWQQPFMPWERSSLYCQKLVGMAPLGDPLFIAGEEEESICQPSFHSSGDIYFVSDRNNWWNLYLWRQGRIHTVLAFEAEFAYPLWVFGMRTYEFIDDETIACIVNENGRQWLGLIQRGRIEELVLDYTYFSPSLAVIDQTLYVIAAQPASAPAIIAIDLATHELRIVHASAHMLLDASYLSLPMSIHFPVSGGQEAHAFFYPPEHPRCCPLPHEKPPLMVLVHGGPTAAANSALNLKIQYWTSRGFAVVDVNYRGSVGYGREYRLALAGQWGVLDVADCVAAARYLVAQALVDERRIIIKGSSSGGFTVLSALMQTADFAAGVSYYGVADLLSLAGDTHKFELHYLDHLLGPLPQSHAVYQQRSPAYAAKTIRAPVLFFQGLEDSVVPPSQVETMMAAMDANGLAYAYVPFAHEQHGFRDARSVAMALEAELSFYAQLFKFEAVDMVASIGIKHFTPPEAS
jgi:dipeptidyl aminopeptidase/acylaminoacyl peptidase